MTIDCCDDLIIRMNKMITIREIDIGGDLRFIGLDYNDDEDRYEGNFSYNTELGGGDFVNLKDLQKECASHLNDISELFNLRLKLRDMFIMAQNDSGLVINIEFKIDYSSRGYWMEQISSTLG